MFEITLRHKRFLKIWAKQFVIIVGLGIGVILLLSAILAGFVYLGQTYGSGAAFGLAAILLGFGFAAGIAGSLAEMKLAKLEREEERTMDALKKDYSDPLADLDARLNRVFANKSAINYKTQYKPSTKQTP